MAEDINPTSDKRYTWDNKKTGTSNRKARLDRFYISPELTERGGSYEVFPHVEKFSDHCPAMLALFPLIKNRHPRGPRFNTELLKYATYQERLVAAWKEEEDPAGESWLAWIKKALIRVKKAAQEVASTLRSKRFRLEKDSLQKIRDTESYHQQHPGDKVALEIYSAAQLQLEHLTMDALEWHQHEMAALWFKYGDCCSKQFFTFHKPRQKRVNIHSRIGLQIITEQAAKQKAITDFYRALYITESHTVGQGKESGTRCRR